MTPEQEVVVRLRDLEQKTWGSISSELGISRRSARERYARAKKHEHIDPAVQEAMNSFGLETPPQQVWFKNKGYSVQVRPQQVDLLARAKEVFLGLPPAPAIETPANVLEELVTIYPLFDVHLGLRAHAEISGEDVNLEIGAERVKRAMVMGMAITPPSRKAVIINGGDFTHQTDDSNRTRRSGHTLDVDGRNIMTTLKAIEVIDACIQLALTKHEFVEYVSVPGNHDPQNWETILVGLRERYRNHDRVKIDFRVDEFSVIEHGEVALFIHHGDKRTPKDLAMYCAAEFSLVWGRSTYRVLLTGHLHHLKADEFPGIYWIQMPSITARDHHASSHGYKSHPIFTPMTFDLTSELVRHFVRLK